MSQELDQVKLRHEYDRSVEVLKHYATLQFAQLSIFVAFMSDGFFYLYGDKAPAEPILTVGKLAAMMIALLFWVMQESHQYIVGHYLRRCAQLEDPLGYQGLSKLPGMPDYKYAPAKWALRIFYAIILLAWTGSFVSGLYGLFCHSILKFLVLARGREAG